MRQRRPVLIPQMRALKTIRKPKNKTDIDTTNIINPKLPRTRSKGPTDAFNKNVFFTLDVITDKERVAMGPLLNRFECSDAKVVDIGGSDITKYDSELNDHILLTHEELDVPAFIGTEITFSNLWIDRNGNKVDESRMSFSNNTGYFTTKQMVDMVIAFEKVDRPKSSWFGGIDAHHVWFEGVKKDEDGFYFIRWGS